MDAEPMFKFGTDDEVYNSDFHWVFCRGEYVRFRISKSGLPEITPPIAMALIEANSDGRITGRIDGRDSLKRELKEFLNL